MRNIKNEFIRAFSVLLVLVLVCGLAVSAFAAENNEYGIEPYAYSYDAVRTRMINSPIYRALKYLKYDRYSELEDNGYLFTPEYVANSLKNKYTSGALAKNPLTDIGYNNKSGAWGTAYTQDENGNNVPNVAEFENKGLMCSSFVEYYFMNYLYRVERADVWYLIMAYEDARIRIRDGNEVYGGDIWYEMAESLVAEGSADVHRFDPGDSIAPDDGEDETEGHQRYVEMFDTLPIGALIRFGYPDYGSYNDDYRHYGIYAGTYNGVHYMIHVGNSRGPEITVVEYMASSSDNSKKSYPLAFYVFENTVEQYGSLTVKKQDEDGKPLAGAEFLLVDNDTGTADLLITDSTGTAIQSNLPLNNKFTLTETAAPPGYEIAEEHEWTFTLTYESPSFSVTVINNPSTGGIGIIKIDDTGKALSGVQFGVYSDASCTASVGTITTNNEGVALLSDLIPDDIYYLKEKEALAGYVYDDTVYPVTVIADTVTYANNGDPVVNTRMGWIRIIKTDPDDSLGAGYVFGIYSDADCTDLVETITTNDNGIATSGWLVPSDAYYVKELSIPETDIFHTLNEQAFPVQVLPGETTEVKVENPFLPGQITILKKSQQGENLAGAKFLLEWSEDGENWQKAVYNDVDRITKGTCTSEGLEDSCLITDSTGIITFTGLHPKLYYRITELEAPEGYLLLTDYVYTGQLPEDTLGLDFTVVNAKTFELPKTGTTSMTLMPVALLLCTATCMGVLLYLRKKKES